MIFDHLKPKTNVLPNLTGELSNHSSQSEAPNIEEAKNKKIIVSYVDRSKGNKLRNFDRRQACFYCNKLHSKVSKHYEVCHSKEEEVKNILSYPKGRSRNELMEKLQLKGNYLHNMKVITENNGTLIVVRRPSYDTDYSEFLPCVHCLGFFKKCELYKHTPRCKFRETDDTSSHINDSKIMVLVNTTNTKFLKMLSTRGKNDEINRVIKKDHLMLSFGELLYACYGDKHYNYISQRLRELSRFLIKFNELGCNSSLIDILNAEKFDDIVKVTNSMVYSEDSTQKPKSFGIRLGHSLKKCCIVAKSRAIKTKNNALKSQVQDFLEVFEAEWTKRVSAVGLRNLYDEKLNKEENIPLTSDIMKLSNYLTSEIKDKVQKGIREMNWNIYSQLAKLTLCKIVTFNKRRGGEVSRMLLRDYINRPTWEVHRHDEIFNSLSSFEKKWRKI